MTNSPLVSHKRISPNRSRGRVHATHNPKGVIDKITIHHVTGVLSIETLGNVFAPATRKASSNYGVGNDGRIGMYVEEKDRSWCTSSAANDYRAITIEVSNSKTGGNWPVSDKALQALINLCVDICKRNGIKKLNYTGNKSGNLTMHKWFSNTNCPGPYLESKFPYIAAEVNKILGGGATTPTPSKPADPAPGKDYTVRVTAAALNYRSGPGTSYKINGTIRDKGIYTITETKGGWGRLKSGAGWIHLGYTQKAGGAAPVKTIQAGSKVQVKASAKTYSTGQAIPGWVKKNTYVVGRVDKTKALLQGINSWVDTKDLELK